MSPWYLPSLLPILLVAAVLAVQALQAGRRGLAAWSLSLVAWAASKLLTVWPVTAEWGDLTLMVGYFVPAAYLHAVAEDLQWRTKQVRATYALAAVMTALGALPSRPFLEAGGTAPGPWFVPMFALAGVMSLYPLALLTRALLQGRDPGTRERQAYLLLAGLLSTFGGGVNILLSLLDRRYPGGLYMVLAALALLSWVVQAARLPDFGRFVQASLRYSLVAALLSTGFVLLLWMVVQSGVGAAAYSWGAAFTVFFVVLVTQPLLFWARGHAAARLFPGKGDVGGVVRALAESEARAEHAGRLAELGTLASAVAHEVRNPLGVIQAAVAGLDRQGADPALVHEIREQVHRASRFADELLAYGRPDAVQLRPLSLVDVAALAVSELERGLSQGLGVAFPAVEVRGGAPPVQGDLGQLGQLVRTLVENAVLAGATRVQLTVDAAGAGARLVVADDGPGVPEALADRLFAPFVSGRSRESVRPGTGLGLAIAQGVAARHHGTLEHRGRDPELGGARFELWLPAEPPLPAR